jgi:mannose/fructose/N-acetylgalactosamine-specific phosphotransferase system component IIC
MIHDAFLAGIIGSLLCLDRFQFLQAMLSRPIVSGPIIGIALGDIEAGLATGVLYELFWLRRPPVGGYIPPDPTVVAIAGAAVCAILQPETAAGAKSLAFLIFLLFLPIAYISARMDNKLRGDLGKLARSAADRAVEGERGIWVYVLAGIALGILCNFVLLFLIILIGAAGLKEIVVRMSPQTLRAFDFAYYVVPLLGIIDLLIGLYERRFYFIFLTGFLLALLGGLVITFMR